ncbi:hypothetical protein GOC83_09890 [Haloarcula rubripromontorii]|uniref:Uncharacterized protein n=1 Tax=Haloarcula rubripromontorii TaxID=1705562 RepID=A0A847U5I9_9EURY|nr:hypothetical protein [Haloarcula rubripromontorii]NLV06438.1 hypothetical protein [Haloarcula rubripromontorii]
MVIGHDCDNAVRVVVRDSPLADEPIAVPVIDKGVTVHEQKEGPMSITRMADIHFPIEGALEEINEDLDRDIGSWWEVFHDDSEIYTTEGSGSPENTSLIAETETVTPTEVMRYARTVDIQLGSLNVDGTFTDEQTIFRGYISARGSGEETINTGHVELQDPSRFLSTIEAGHHFLNPDFETILQYVIDEFVDGQPYFDTVSLEGEALERPVVPQYSLTRDNENHPTHKKFNSNRDTLRDVIDWVITKGNVRLWFEPGDVTDLELHVERNPKRQFDATGGYVDGGSASSERSSDSESDAVGEGDDSPIDPNLWTLKNNALYEMRPFNTLILRGVDGIRKRLGGAFGPEVLVAHGDGTYPEARAFYPPLVERSGGRITATEPSNARTVGAVEREAKSMLKEMLDSVSGGTIHTALAPSVRPFDTVLATPTCNGRSAIDIDPIEYEVQRTAHTYNVDADGELEVPHTELSVSLHVNPSKIEVNTATKKVQVNEDSADKPDSDTLFEQTIENLFFETGIDL